MSSQISLVANEPVRVTSEPARHGDAVDRAGGSEADQQSTSPVSTTPVPVEIPAPKLENAVETVRTAARNLQRQLQFTVDESSGRTIITVIDRESGKVIRQIPPEELLQIAESAAGGGRMNLIDGRA